MLRQPTVFTRHNTHKILRTTLAKRPYRVAVRFGSTTPSIARVQVNTIEAVKNASDKIRMKELFREHGVRSPEFVLYTPGMTAPQFPCVAKMRFRARGIGMYKIDNQEQWEAFLQERRAFLSKYCFEEYKKSDREYRIHVSSHFDESFFSVIKRRRPDTPREERFGRHHDTYYFKLEFNQPQDWEAMVSEAVKACRAVGLDMGAVDLIYNTRTRDFQVLEINSAPSMQDTTADHYRNAIERIIDIKHAALPPLPPRERPARRPAPVATPVPARPLRKKKRRAAVTR